MKWEVLRELMPNEQMRYIVDKDELVPTLDNKSMTWRLLAYGPLTRAEANLMAAAPELLEIAELAVRACEELGFGKMEAVDDMRAVIAKARGEAVE